MSYDKKKIYIVSLLYAMSLLLALFASTKTAANITLAVTSAVIAAAALYFIKKKRAFDLRKNDAALVCALFAVICTVILCLIGAKFGVYAKKFSYKSIYTHILPFAVTITANELLRSRLLSQNVKWIKIFAYVLFVFSDVLLFREKLVLRSAANLMSLFGIVILPAATSNVLYHVLSAKYGPVAVIPYRFIVSLSFYFLPIGFSTPEVLIAFLQIIFPLLLLSLIRFLFEAKKLAASYKASFAQTAISVISLVAMLLSILFTAGVFEYKSIVVASDSMKTELGRGDIVIYKDFSQEILQPGQIILFEKNGDVIIHRIVEIKKINGVYRYFTKGDANDGIDTGYITNEDIVGTSKLKIKYLGYPTVWIHDLFK